MLAMRKEKGLFNLSDGKIFGRREGHKEWTLIRAKFSFDCQTAVTYVTYIRTLRYVRMHVRPFGRRGARVRVPETARVCVSREGVPTARVLLRCWLARRVVANAGDISAGWRLCGDQLSS